MFERMFGLGAKPPVEWTALQFVIWAAGVRGERSTPSYLMSLTNWVTQDEIKRRVRMAKKKGGKKLEKGADFKGYVRISLTAERKEACKEWEATWEEVITLFSELVLDDYRVSFSPANDGNAVQCSITCRDDASLNAGWCLTSRAPEWQDALRVSMWKHFVLCDRDWSEYLEGDVADSWG